MTEDYFTEVADAALGIASTEFAGGTARIRRYGVKIWFGDEPKEHYEAQVISGAQLEIGFHSEHPKVEQNQAVLDVLMRHEATWRSELGDEAIAGVFLGDRTQRWRRISEVWPDEGTFEQEVAMEVGDRLATYIVELERIRQATAN